MMRSIPIILLALSLTACGSAPEAGEDDHRTTEQSVTEDASEPTQAAPEFIIVSRNAQLFTKPSEDAPFIRYRSPEKQVEFEKAQRERAVKKAEKQQKQFQKEIERETKRLKRIKDEEKQADYVLKRRKSRARRYLKAIDKRVRRSKEGHPNSRYLTLEFLEEKDGWVRARTLGHTLEGGQCYSNALPGVRSAQMEFWVRSKDLKQVTIRREIIQVWRGSEVKLAPGVVLEKDGRHWIATVDGFRLRLDVPDDARGTRFSSRGFFEAPFTDTVFTDIALAEGHLKIDRKQSLPYNPHFPLRVTATLWVGKRFYVTTQTPCAELTVHAKEKWLDTAGRRNALRLDHQQSIDEKLHITKGSLLFWPDGSEAGRTTEDMLIGNERQSTKSQRRCFSQEIWKQKKKKKRRKKRRKRKDPNPEWILGVCADAENIQDAANQ